MDASPLNELSSVLEQLVERIGIEEVAIFCGAGISKNPPSNLPLARDLRKSIVESLIDVNIFEEEVRRKLEGGLGERGIRYPLEAFLQTVDANAPFIDTLIEIYRLGKPNKNHVLFSELMKNGYVKEIMTTNFDTKIEEALESSFEYSGELWSEGVDFNVFYEESQFLKADLEHLKAPALFKVHGTIRNRESIRATLEAISRRKLREARAKIVRHFFKEAEHDILIVGYGVEDEFDINPVLRGLKSRNRVFLVEHPKNEAKLGVFKLEGRDPFKGFEGWFICYDTDYIIDYIWRNLIEKPWRKYEQANEEWEKPVKDWSQNLQEPIRFFTLAAILQGIQEYEMSEKFYTLCLEAFKKDDNQTGVAASLHQLAMIQQYRGNYSEAEKLYSQKLSISEELGDRPGIVKALNQLAKIKSLKGDYKEAEKLYRRSLSISEELRDWSGIATLLNNLANIKFLEGNYSEAETLYKQSLRIRQDLGDQYGIATSLHQLAMIQHYMKNYNEAENLYRQSLQISQSLGNQSGIAHSLHGVAAIQEDRGNYDEAERLYKQSLSIFENLGDQYEIAISFRELGRLKEQRGELDLAIEYYGKALELFIKMGQRQYERIAREDLERTRSKLGEKNKS